MNNNRDEINACHLTASRIRALRSRARNTPCSGSRESYDRNLSSTPPPPQFQFRRVEGHVARRLNLQLGAADSFNVKEQRQSPCSAPQHYQHQPRSSQPKCFSAGSTFYPNPSGYPFLPSSSFRTPKSEENCGCRSGESSLFCVSRTAVPTVSSRRFHCVDSGVEKPSSSSFNHFYENFSKVTTWNDSFSLSFKDYYKYAHGKTHTDSEGPERRVNASHKKQKVISDFAPSSDKATNTKSALQKNFQPTPIANSLNQTEVKLRDFLPSSTMDENPKPEPVPFKKVDGSVDDDSFSDSETPLRPSLAICSLKQGRERERRRKPRTAKPLSANIAFKKPLTSSSIKPSSQWQKPLKPPFSVTRARTDTIRNNPSLSPQADDMPVVRPPTAFAPSENSDSVPVMNSTGAEKRKRQSLFLTSSESSITETEAEYSDSSSDTKSAEESIPSCTNHEGLLNKSDSEKSLEERSLDEPDYPPERFDYLQGPEPCEILRVEKRQTRDITIEPAADKFQHPLHDYPVITETGDSARLNNATLAINAASESKILKSSSTILPRGSHSTTCVAFHVLPIKCQPAECLQEIVFQKCWDVKHHRVTFSAGKLEDCCDCKPTKSCMNKASKPGITCPPSSGILRGFQKPANKKSDECSDARLAPVVTPLRPCAVRHCPPEKSPCQRKQSAVFLLDRTSSNALTGCNPCGRRRSPSTSESRLAECGVCIVIPSEPPCQEQAPKTVCGTCPRPCSCSQNQLPLQPSNTNSECCQLYCPNLQGCNQPGSPNPQQDFQTSFNVSQPQSSPSYPSVPIQSVTRPSSDQPYYQTPPPSPSVTHSSGSQPKFQPYPYPIPIPVPSLPQAYNLPPPIRPPAYNSPQFRPELSIMALYSSSTPPSSRPLSIAETPASPPPTIRSKSPSPAERPPPPTPSLPPKSHPQVPEMPRLVSPSHLPTLEYAVPEVFDPPSLIETPLLERLPLLNLPEALDIPDFSVTLPPFLSEMNLVGKESSPRPPDIVRIQHPELPPAAPPVIHPRISSHLPELSTSQPKLVTESQHPPSVVGTPPPGYPLPPAPVERPLSPLVAEPPLPPALVEPPLPPSQDESPPPPVVPPPGLKSTPSSLLRSDPDYCEKQSYEDPSSPDCNRRMSYSRGRTPPRPPRIRTIGTGTKKAPCVNSTGGNRSRLNNSASARPRRRKDRPDERDSWNNNCCNSCSKRVNRKRQEWGEPPQPSCQQQCSFPNCGPVVVAMPPGSIPPIQSRLLPMQPQNPVGSNCPAGYIPCPCQTQPSQGQWLPQQGPSNFQNHEYPQIPAQPQLPPELMNQILRFMNSQGKRKSDGAPGYFNQIPVGFNLPNGPTFMANMPPDIIKQLAQFASVSNADGGRDRASSGGLMGFFLDPGSTNGFGNKQVPGDGQSSNRSSYTEGPEFMNNFGGAPVAKNGMPFFIMPITVPLNSSAQNTTSGQTNACMTPCGPFNACQGKSCKRRVTGGRKC